MSMPDHSVGRLVRLVSEFWEFTGYEELESHELVEGDHGIWVITWTGMLAGGFDFDMNAYLIPNLPFSGHVEVPPIVAFQLLERLGSMVNDCNYRAVVWASDADILTALKSLKDEAHGRWLGEPQ